MLGGQSADLPKAPLTESIIPIDKNLPNKVGLAVSDYFRSVHSGRSATEIWLDSEQAGWEGLSFRANTPGDRNSGTMGNTFDPTGNAEFMIQPVDGDGSNWEYNSTQYTIPFTDGRNHLHSGQIKNTRLVMQNGELSYVVTSVNMRGGSQVVEEIKYVEADEQQRGVIDQALKDLWNYKLHPQDPHLE